MKIWLYFENDSGVAGSLAARCGCLIIHLFVDAGDLVQPYCLLSLALRNIFIFKCKKNKQTLTVASVNFLSRTSMPTTYKYERYAVLLSGYSIQHNYGLLLMN